MEQTPENNDEEARVLLKETNSRRPPVGFTHWYVYQCADTTETRGERGARMPPCGYYNVRATLDAVEEVLR